MDLSVKTVYVDLSAKAVYMDLSVKTVYMDLSVNGRHGVVYDNVTPLQGFVCSL